MSFKSKQRAKHGHLFGDDPLNASTISSLDSPSTKANRPKSPMDPLSRSSSPGSTNGSHSPDGSIFGGIDVSKFGSKQRNTLRSSTSLRPTSSLKLVDDSDDDDDDFLFGGGRKTSTSSSLHKRKVSATSNSLGQAPKSVTNDLPTGSPRINHSTIIAPTPLSPSIGSSLTGAPTLQPQRLESNSSTPSPPPTLNSQTLAQPKPKPNNTSPAKKPPPPPPARRPASISKSAVSPLVSSSTSSLSSFSSSTSSSSPVMGHSQQPPLNNVPPPPPPRTHKKHQQQQILSRQMEVDEDNEEETRMMQRQKAAMMEDEGTRAFAMAPSASTSVLSPSSSMMMQYDDPELYASVTQFQSLAITGSSSTPTNKPNMSFIPSNTSNNISHSSSSSSLAPTNTNPWHSNMTMTAPFPTATTTTPLPSTKRQQDLDKRLKEIEPAKRTAFADLIANWHNTNNTQQQADDDSDAEFFEHVASEQRDIGFAGIDDAEDDKTRFPSSFDWQENSLLDVNPWS